ncbi:GGDEF domain-containing protein [Chelativorans sp. AA-79]|uniref:GGDEF domain-containing protein n=1 Tax=Chelativorans sp. AA-79 TaxID=3028735 RepID=UPI0023F74443|nr:GGDEF domain-containing protein [Chelativorans sp. AA-79]WEX08453.1 GGDEF domain-containing protein [Chelativorans sp. AA-79]
MRKVFLKAGIATLISIAVSLAICAVALKLVGGSMDLFAATMCTLCPLVVAFPASAYTYNQTRRIAEAHKALEAAHRELTVLHQKLAESARLDDMTGLFNRSAFIAAVERTRTAENRGALILIDADNFKQINDTFGHLAGDQALVAIAGAIRRATPGTDPVGRIGGEEFGAFVTEVSPVEAHGLAEQIRRTVEETRLALAEGAPVRLTVSIGVVRAPTGASFSEIMSEADQKLYEAKQLGRNRVVADHRVAA